VTTKVLDIHPQNEKVRGSKIIYILPPFPTLFSLEVLLVPCTTCDGDASCGGEGGGVVGKWG
jgi:hypothetical protein